jgi:hypothetical protein
VQRPACVRRVRGVCGGVVVSTPERALRGLAMARLMILLESREAVVDVGLQEIGRPHLAPTDGALAKILHPLPLPRRGGGRDGLLLLCFDLI